MVLDLVYFRKKLLPSKFWVCHLGGVFLITFFVLGVFFTPQKLGEMIPFDQLDALHSGSGKRSFEAFAFGDAWQSEAFGGRD